MAEQDKFGQKPARLRCEEWEALLADALDGLLPANDSSAFTAHSAECLNCADLLAHAQQGREWLEYLHEEPEVPVGLVEKILDQTAGPGGITLPALAAGQAPGVAVAAAMPWRRDFHETRLLMTVAMAFFSIALTLNLAGVKLSSIRLADLRPSAIGSTLSRQFYSTRGQLVRYYDNLRFVYQLESRMRELRRDVEAPSSNSQQNIEKKQPPAKPSGSHDKNGRLDGAPVRGEVLHVHAELNRRAGGLQAAVCGRNRESNREQNDDKTCKVPEVVNLISLDQHKAGLQRAGKTARNDGRSLV